MSYYSFYS